MEIGKPRRRRPMPGTGKPPTVSDSPPERGPAPRWAEKPHGPPVLGPRAASERGRVVVVFGPPGVGKSTMLTCLTDAAETETFVVEPGGQLEEDVQEARDSGAEVVFIDGSVRNAQDVKRLYDLRYVYPGSGAIVLVVTDPEVIVRRCDHAVTRTNVTLFNRALPEIEEAIRVFGMPYYTVHNDDLTTAVLDLAARSGITQ